MATASASGADLIDMTDLEASTRADWGQLTGSQKGLGVCRGAYRPSARSVATTACDQSRDFGALFAGL